MRSPPISRFCFAEEGAGGDDQDGFQQGEGEIQKISGPAVRTPLLKARLMTSLNVPVLFWKSTSHGALMYSTCKNASDPRTGSASARVKSRWSIFANPIRFHITRPGKMPTGALNRFVRKVMRFWQQYESFFNTRTIAFVSGIKWSA
jgi:hypothetical protein